MPKVVLEEVKDLGALPDDTMILIEVVAITERDVPASNGREGWTKFDFKCVIRDLPPNIKADEDYAEMIGSNIYGAVNARFTTHPDNKLRQWAAALLNMGELEPGFELDTDLLVGRQAKAQTSSYEKKDGTGKRHQIQALLPPGPLGGASAVPAYLTDRAAAPAQEPVAVGAGVSQQTLIDDDPPF